ncbi:hypothetical protein [Nonomuraea lactucae]|uniref:hypothetical protein n=1 Tax=Nonomuraea lactucae TaxID=2249762 RepID=UPI0013B376E9|nr:hypothetical protein [Nonomuraea lactucae]
MTFDGINNGFWQMTIDGTPVTFPFENPTFDLTPAQSGMGRVTITIPAEMLEVTRLA